MATSALPFVPHVVLDATPSGGSVERALLLGIATSLGLWLAMVEMTLWLFG